MEGIRIKVIIEVIIVINNAFFFILFMKEYRLEIIIIPHYLIFSSTISLISFASAFPFVSRMTCPTRNSMAFLSPLL